MPVSLMPQVAEPDASVSVRYANPMIRYIAGRKNYEEKAVNGRLNKVNTLIRTLSANHAKNRFGSTFE